MFGRRKPSAASSSASTPKRKEERETELLEETRLTKELLEKQLGIDGSVTEKVLNILLQNEVFTIGALLALFQNPDKGEEKLQKLGIGLGSVALIAKFCAGLQTPSGPKLGDKRFQPSLFRKNDFEHYIKPKIFDQLVTLTVNNHREMQRQQERNILFGLAQGLMGVGKSRLGAEASLAVVARLACLDPPDKPIIATTGYLGSSGLLGVFSQADIQDDRKCVQVALRAIVYSLQNEDALGFSPNEVRDKLERDLNTNTVVLHVDEYARNEIGVKMFWKGCVLLAVQSEIFILPIVTGIYLLNGDKPPQGSKFQTKPLLLQPLDQESEILNMFHLAIGYKAPKPCMELEALIEDCGGHPASLAFLADAILRSRVLKHSDEELLLSKGVLDPYLAKSLFGEVVDKINRVYGEEVWYKHLSGNADANGRLSDNSKEILTIVLLVCVGDVPVKKEDVVQRAGKPVKRKVEVTFNHLQTYGLLTLEDYPDKPGLVRAYMPFFALAAINKFLHAVPGDVLLNPFLFNDRIQEELAIVSLFAKISALSLLRGSGMEIKFSDLRPKALNIGDVSIVLPIFEEVTFAHLGRFLDDDKLPLQTGVKAGSGPPKTVHNGSFLMSANNQKAIDGAAKFNDPKGKSVLLLSQSKWRDPFPPQSSGESTTTLTTAPVKSWSSQMADLSAMVAERWEIGKPSFIVYDIFTDQHQGKRMTLPEAEPGVAVFVTTLKNIEACIGPALAVRSRHLKRVAEDNDTGERKKQNREE